MSPKYLIIFILTLSSCNKEEVIFSFNKDFPLALYEDGKRIVFINETLGEREYIVSTVFSVINENPPFFIQKRLAPVNQPLPLITPGVIISNSIRLNYQIDFSQGFTNEPLPTLELSERGIVTEGVKITSQEINGIIYRDVIRNHNFGEFNTFEYIYFKKDIGILAFNDAEGNLWSFDRFVD